MRGAIRTLIAIAMTTTALAGGCASYTTPGGPADFRALGVDETEARAMTPSSIRERMDRRPAAGFPASIAVARVQDAGYRSMTIRNAYGQGMVTLVTVRDVETDEQFEHLASMPMVRGIAPLNRLVVTRAINDMHDLRTSAAEVQADMLLLYTFDTVFKTETNVPAMGVLTLGLFPDREARVTSTASAVLVDTRTGYVYGLAESTDDTAQPANAWTSRAAVDQSRRRAERRAFEDLVGQLETMWSGVISTYGPSERIGIADGP